MLNPKSLGLAGGILWGVSMIILCFLNMFFGYSPMLSAMLVDLYPGYEVTLFGAFIGFVWGFADAFIGLYILAWLYNKLNT